LVRSTAPVSWFPPKCSDVSDADGEIDVTCQFVFAQK
jgi:hypothetical protein